MYAVYTKCILRTNCTLYTKCTKCTQCIQMHTEYTKCTLSARKCALRRILRGGIVLRPRKMATHVSDFAPRKLTKMIKADQILPTCKANFAKQNGFACRQKKKCMYFHPKTLQYSDFQKSKSIAKIGENALKTTSAEFSLKCMFLTCSKPACYPHQK